MPASLLKIPLLIIMGAVNHISYQAPHQASSNELVAVVGLPEKIFTTAISLGFMGFWQVVVPGTNLFLLCLFAKH
jgi:hypothetical protein